MIDPTLAVLLVTLFLCWTYHWSKRPKGLPPGPAISLPIVGDALTVGTSLIYVQVEINYFMFGELVQCCVEFIKRAIFLRFFFTGYAIRLLSAGFSRTLGFKRLHDRYGKIFSCNIGKQRVIVTSDFDLIQEIGGKEECANRSFSKVTFSSEQNLMKNVCTS